MKWPSFDLQIPGDVLLNDLTSDMHAYNANNVDAPYTQEYEWTTVPKAMHTNESGRYSLVQGVARNQLITRSCPSIGIVAAQIN